MISKIFVTFAVLLFRISITTANSDHNNNLRLTQLVPSDESLSTYWDIDHQKASSIWYEPADKISNKQVNFGKQFVISYPILKQGYSNDEKKEVTTLKGKRNSYSDTNVNENIVLDVGIQSSPRLSNEDALLEEFFANDNIEDTKQILTDCLDLHVYVLSLDVNSEIDWNNLISANKVNILNQLSRDDLVTIISQKCKPMEKIIEKNLNELKSSLLKRKTKTDHLSNPNTVVDLDEYINNVSKAGKTNTSNGDKSGEHIFAVQDLNNTFAGITSSENTKSDIDSGKPLDQNYVLINEGISNLLEVDNYTDTTENEFYAIKANNTKSDDSNITQESIKDIYKETLPLNASEYNTNEAHKSVEDSVSESNILADDNETTDSIQNAFTELMNGTAFSEIRMGEKDKTKNDLKNGLTDTSEQINRSQNQNAILLNGTLYFNFGDIQVPAHFIQNSDGVIQVGINGTSVCAQLVGDFKSILLQRICNEIN